MEWRIYHVQEKEKQAALVCVECKRYAKVLFDNFIGVD